MVLSVSERTFIQEVLESPIPVLVNFEAPWCGLCRILYPLLLQFQSQCEKQIKLVGVNADENYKLSTRYELKSLPTLLLFENGAIKYRLEGFRGRDDLRIALEEIQLTYSNKSYSRTQEPYKWQPYHVIVFKPQGNINSLSKRLDGVIPQPHQVWVIDLSEVNFIDNSELGFLVKTLKSAYQNSCRVVLCNVSSPVKVTMELAQMDSIFKIFNSYEDILLSELRVA